MRRTACKSTTVVTRLCLAVLFRVQLRMDVSHVCDSILFPSSCVLCCVHRFNLCTFLWCPPAHGNMVGGGSTIAGRAATVSAVQLSSIKGSNRSQSQFLPPLLCRVFSTCRFCRTPIQSNPIYMNTDGSTAIFKTFTTYYTPNEFVTLGPVGYISNLNFPHGVLLLVITMMISSFRFNIVVLRSSSSYNGS